MKTTEYFGLDWLRFFMLASRSLHSMLLWGCPWRLLVMLWYVILSLEAPCYVMLSLEAPCYICYVLLSLCYVILSVEAPCYVMLCGPWRLLVMQCHVVLGGSLLCYVMLYCPWRLIVMLFYIVLGGSLLCYVMLSLGRLLVILCYIVLRGSLLSYFMLSLEVTCYVMLYCSWRVLVMLCYVVLGGSLSWYVMLSLEAAQSEENMLIELQGWGKYWNMRVAQSFQESLDFQKKETTVTTLCRRRAKISKQYVPLALNCNVPRTLLCCFLLQSLCWQWLAYNCK